ncbi:MAG: glycosyltransferase family 4 protein [Pseudonocardiaceae bacterium]
METLDGILELGVDAHLVLDSELPRRRGAFVGHRRSARAHDGSMKLGPDVVHWLAADHALRRLGELPVGPAKVLTRFSRFDAGVTGLEQPGYFDSVWEHSDMLEVSDEAVLARLRRRGCPPSKPAAIVPFRVSAVSAPSIVGHKDHQPSGPLKVLSVGALEWAEGFDHAAHAIAVLRRRGVGVQWRVVGVGPYHMPLRFACRQLGVEDWTSIVTPDGVPGLQADLAWADVLLAPGLIDGLTPAIVEALANGVAVVMTDPGALGALAIDGRAVIEVARRDPSAIADAVQSLAHDPRARMSMGVTGRLWAERRFRSGLHFVALASAYEQLSSPRLPRVDADVRAGRPPRLQPELRD